MPTSVLTRNNFGLASTEAPDEAQPKSKPPAFSQGSGSRGHDCGSGGGFDRGCAAEDGSGDESNEKADGQGLHEGVGHVDEGVLVELLRPLYGSDLRGGGGGVQSGGLDLVNLRGEVAVHEVGHEVEVEDLPHGGVADGGDEGDQDAAGEAAAEGDLAGEGVIAVAADAEVD